MPGAARQHYGLPAVVALQAVIRGRVLHCGLGNFLNHRGGLAEFAGVDAGLGERRARAP